MIKTILPTASKTTAFQIACDGKSVLQRLQKTNITDPNKPHADLLSSTRQLLKTSNLTVLLHHVKGHQDSRHFGPHTRDATLNIEADRLAKEKLEDYKPGPKNFHIPWSQGVCYTGQHRTVKDFATTIRDHINGQATIAYWTKRRQLSQGIWNTFDWASIGRAMKEIPIN